jgi:hypothetical protein
MEIKSTTLLVKNTRELQTSTTDYTVKPQTNLMHLTLIPGKDEALIAKDFRPISLVHSFAKLVTKIMGNRLAPLLHSLVATNQSAFIQIIAYMTIISWYIANN